MTMQVCFIDGRKAFAKAFDRVTARAGALPMARHIV